ncbi:tryptophan transporter [Enterobacter cloacae]|nr:tryptophan transporter [Enterobacter cloacae]
MLTYDNYYHMILVIIIGMKGQSMLNRALGSGWGVLLPGVILGGLMFADLSIETWKAIIVSGLLVTSAMIWHKQLRHFVLLPSCVALVSGILVILMSLK